VTAVTIALTPTPAENHVSGCARIDYLQQQTQIVDIGLAAAYQENFRIGQERFFGLLVRFYVADCPHSIDQSGLEVDCQ
jgi:hypothetical protein